MTKTISCNDRDQLELRVFIPQEPVKTIIVNQDSSIRSLYRIHKNENRVLIYNGLILDQKKKFGDYDFHQGDAIFAIRNTESENTKSWMEASEDPDELCFRMSLQTNPSTTKVAARLVDLIMMRLDQKNKLSRPIEKSKSPLNNPEQIQVEIPNRLSEPSTEALPVFWAEDSNDSFEHQLPCIN